MVIKERIGKARIKDTAADNTRGPLTYPRRDIVMEYVHPKLTKPI
jgi:hypothetical protein